jgi:hypothetical protein
MPSRALQLSAEGVKAASRFALRMELQNPRASMIIPGLED